MRRLALLPAAIAFLLNPSACSDNSEPQYQYGAEEMRAAVEGTWDLALKLDTGETATLALTIEQAKATASAPKDTGPELLRAAHACGTRTLIASADACADSSEMPLKVEYLSGDTSIGNAVLWDEARGPASIFGNFRVNSLLFYGGELYVNIGDLYLSARINSDDTTKSAYLFGPPPARASTEATLTRRPQ